LSQVLTSPEAAAAWLRGRVVGTLTTDSRHAGAGDGFIAWPGAARDGREYVAEALAADVAACLVEDAGAQLFGFHGERVMTYPGLKAAAAPIAAAYFDQPSLHLQVVAVTGTNGKTSTTWWLAQALGKVGLRCGVVGTLGIGEPRAMVLNGLTTPDPVLLQQQFRRFVDNGFSACALEASSIGIAERRLDATQISLAIFTNFTQDHLDYHGSTQAYWEAKKSLFAWPGLRAAVLNVDDAKGVELADDLACSGLDVWTISIKDPARLCAGNIHQSDGHLSFDVIEGAERHTVRVGTAGLYNVSNLLGVIAAMRVLGIALSHAVSACQDLRSVPGRLDIVTHDASPLVVIDYAHTPDALEKVLLALQPVAQERHGRLWCVFGCGGNRDRSKRPLMAAVAQQYADHAIVTSDNPRRENPADIITDIVSGFDMDAAFEVLEDRAVAVSQAIFRAEAADVVLVAGKGHEDYQEICGVKHPFSDRQHAEAAIDARSPSRQQQGYAA
jgi:UDP-N-acetylmuramyl-tripeptide synthetase